MSIEEVFSLNNNLNSNEIQDYWKKCLEGDLEAQNKLKIHYMKSLNSVKPLYKNIEEKVFFNTIEASVSKALERAYKFKVEDFETYMPIASQTYFKYNIYNDNNNNSLNIPSPLFKAFSKIKEVFSLVPKLGEKDEQTQIHLLSKGFEYPVFPTRLLYYSYKKWINNNLRQVDIDLCVALLPAPQRIEWEIFYEKDVQSIKKTIIEELQI